MKTQKITISTIMVILALICLYAVLFLHRADHLLTTAGFVLLAKLPWVE